MTPGGLDNTEFDLVGLVTDGMLYRALTAINALAGGQPEPPTPPCKCCKLYANLQNVYIDGYLVMLTL